MSLISLDTFKAKVKECGKPCSDFKTGAFFASVDKERLPINALSTPETPAVPPRLVSDQMINIFFQEWAPLFPIVHRPTILKQYTEYLANPHNIRDNHTIAHLNLIFGIAALSAEVRYAITSAIGSALPNFDSGINKMQMRSRYSGRPRWKESCRRTLYLHCKLSCLPRCIASQKPTTTTCYTTRVWQSAYLIDWVSTRAKSASPWVL